MESQEITIIDNKQHQIVLLPFNNQSQEEVLEILKRKNLRHATRNETDVYLEKLSKKYDTGFPQTILGFVTDGSLCQTVTFLEEKGNTDKVCVIAKAGLLKDFIAIGFWEEIDRMIPPEDYLGVVAITK